MTTQTHQPWKPTCWVGGWLLPGRCIDNVWLEWDWVGCKPKELQSLSDDSRQKYAASKATAAILRSMRK